jgi:hypothetical protein
VAVGEKGNVLVEGGEFELAAAALGFSVFAFDGKMDLFPAGPPPTVYRQGSSLQNYHRSNSRGAAGAATPVDIAEALWPPLYYKRVGVVDIASREYVGALLQMHGPG